MTAPRYITHCKRGHEFTPENTYTLPDGKRVCRKCKAIRLETYNAGKKAIRERSASVEEVRRQATRYRPPIMDEWPVTLGRDVWPL